MTVALWMTPLIPAVSLCSHLTGYLSYIHSGMYSSEHLCEIEVIPILQRGKVRLRQINSIPSTGK